MGAGFRHLVTLASPKSHGLNFPRGGQATGVGGPVARRPFRGTFILRICRAAEDSLRAQQARQRGSFRLPAYGRKGPDVPHLAKDSDDLPGFERAFPVPERVLTFRPA